MKEKQEAPLNHPLSLSWLWRNRVFVPQWFFEGVGLTGTDDSSLVLHHDAFKRWRRVINIPRKCRL